MTTNKPKVVAYARTGALASILPRPWRLPVVSDWSPMYSDALIRLSDYEALQAERDAAFALLRECQLILREECGARIDYVELNAFLEGNASAMDILAACGQGGDV